MSLPHLQDDAVRTRVSAVYADPDSGLADLADQVADIEQWLWVNALEPVVAELGKLPDVIVPVGLLGLLPLQAAEPTLDLGPVITAPNIRVWLEARRRVQPVFPGADAVDTLAVGDPIGGAPLPLAAAEGRLVDAAFGTGGRALTGADALKPVVAERLRTAAVVHLACHGEADLLEPTHSGVLLAHSSVLTVADLVRMQLKARLVVLSACRTALPRTPLPDEVVGLPSALVRSGAAGAIASQWRVADDTALLLMAAFYTYWHRAPEAGPARALHAARRWRRDTTNREKDAFLGSATDVLGSSAAECQEVLILRDPDARDFNSPAHWAAFAFVGS